MEAITKPRSGPEQTLRQVDEDGVEFIRLWFTDIMGQLKSFAVGREELEGALAEGMGFDGSSITGFNRIEESDMIAMPDPETYTVLPWRTDGHKGNVARMFCDILKPGGEPYEGDPRFVMRRALARAEELGFDTYNIGPELEYFYFASDELNEAGVPTILDKGGYFDLTTLDAASDLRRDTVNALKAVGIPVEYTHHEVGPSQHEIDMRYAEGLRMSDNAMTYRIVVKEIASQHGVYATFMPKPLFGENGSGMHTHQSLFSEGSNAFFDPDDAHHLSGAAKAYIARAPSPRA
jgi:glutamine synthetase